MLFLILMLAISVRADNQRPPNILVVLADDLGWNDFGFHGSNQIKTPNVDALVYNGVALEKFYAQQACTPSRSAFLTGQYPIRTGMQGVPIDAGENRTLPHDRKYLPVELKKLGYRTHLVGKWHLGASVERALPMAYGYDTHYGYWNGYIGYFNYRIKPGTGKDDFSGVDFHDGLVPVNETSGEDFTDLLTKRAVDIIDCHSNNHKKEPLFLVLSHLAGHTSKPVDGNTVLEVRNETYTNEKYSHIPTPTRRMLAEIVENMDSSLGIVVDKLQIAQLLSNTIIFFLSDNGGPTYGPHSNEASNFPLRGIKMSAYEGAVRVPAAIYSHNCSNPGRTFNNLFHITDMAPTLYRAAGGDPSSFGIIDGIDQWDNVCHNKNQNKREELLVNIDDKAKYEAYIGYNGKYKYLKSRLLPHDYTGDSGRTGTYSFNEVYDSLTNKAIIRLKQEGPLLELRKYVALIEKYKSLRASMTLSNCRLNTAPDNCNLVGCLFDLFADPCEAKDVYLEHREIYAELERKVENLRKQAVPQQNKLVDDTANPRFCNDTWFPWLSANGCFYQKAHKPQPPNHCI